MGSSRHDWKMRIAISPRFATRRRLMGRWTGGMVDWEGVRAFVKTIHRPGIYKDFGHKESEIHQRPTCTPEPTVSLGCKKLSTPVLSFPAMSIRVKRAPKPVPVKHRPHTARRFYSTCVSVYVFVTLAAWEGMTVEMSLKSLRGGAPGV